MRLIESLATTEALAEVFSDRSVLAALLQFEVGLARTQARQSLIPQAAADAITTAAQPDNFDIGTLAAEMLRAGTPGIPIVKALTEVVRRADPSAAGYVHWGATSQDVADTAMVLLLKRAQPLLENDLSRLQSALRRLADDHASTVMLGRTLMQSAPPITFGLKAAQWLESVGLCSRQLRDAFSLVSFVQFGGASGTLAALGMVGDSVGQGLARDLDLKYPPAPWHTRREGLARLVCACGVLTGALGKIGRDISLLMQNEVAEVSEPGGPRSRRLVDDAAQAQSNRMCHHPGVGQSRTGTGRFIPQLHGAGARTRRRRLAGGVADSIAGVSIHRRSGGRLWPKWLKASPSMRPGCESISNRHKG